jgi:hypothetical protein
MDSCLFAELSNGEFRGVECLSDLTIGEPVLLSGSKKGGGDGSDRLGAAGKESFNW